MTVSLLCIASLSSIARPASARSTQDLQDQLHRKVQEWVSGGQLARPDGFIYAVDIGQLLAYAATNGDYNLYVALRDFATRYFILNNPSDPFTQGFVVWRYRNTTPPEASGTTEALRLAEGLWLGSRMFGEPADRERALLILQGYARHAYVDQGVWLIRNYFNLQTRSFVTNSFLVDYDPDFVREVADAVGDSELYDVARQSYALISRAVAPSRLLYEMIQPEVLTILPDLDLVVFSPNDIVQLSNSCTVAERAVREAPVIGEEILAFALQHRFLLKSYYYGISGRPASDRGPGPGTYACLVRLAVKLKDQQAINSFFNPLMAQVGSFIEAPYEPRLYVASEFLLALQTLR